jgi:NAD(P)-dependent dehydrogenase (short-subunit alcohol dehydrogenase family)
VVGEVPEVTGAVVAALSSDGYRVRQVVPGEAVRQLQADRYEADLSTPQDLAELHRLVAGVQETPVGAVINFLGLCRSFCRPDGEESEASVRIAEWTFHVVKEFAQDLRTSAAAGGGWFINLTALGGQFGLNGSSMSSPTAAGTLGITKTFGREYPDLYVRTVDVDSNIPPHLLAARLLSEMGAKDDLPEVGLTRHGRWQPALELAPRPHLLPLLELGPESVVLITGGAAGITADVAQTLAASFRPRLILVGRSARPEPESPRTAGLDRAGLRKTLLAEARGNSATVLPAEIERSVDRILKNRQILATIDRCTAAGATVEYHPLDVSDPQQFGRLIDDLYERLGRIDGVVHGAGVIEDRRIADKTTASFTKVFRTKVDSAWVLANKLHPDGLKFLVFFGSVSGRFGNAGQVDYSAANEILNKLADQLNRLWPARVVCINWGPWDAGMVSEDLRRFYASREIGLIPVEVGARAFLDELSFPSDATAEVVISAGVEQMARRPIRN